MGIETIFVMMIHLFVAGLICLGVDYVAPKYTTITFVGYLLVMWYISLNNNLTLFFSLIHNREETLKYIDESLKKE